jgi:uncharacterized protein (DUF2062 family)
MPKRLLKRYLPDHQSIREHKHLRLFGNRLHDPNLWHLNRRSVASAMGVGTFIAFIPIPGHILMAAASAIWLRINLPLTLTTIFITNPITIPPIFYFTYKVGTWLLNTPPNTFTFEFSLHWLLHEASAIFPALLVGSVAVGALAGIIVYAIVQLSWRFYIWRLYLARRNRKLAKQPNSVN